MHQSRSCACSKSLHLYLCWLRPWQPPLSEIDDEVDEGLNVVSPTEVHLVVDVDARKGRIKIARDVLLVDQVLAACLVPVAATMPHVHHENDGRLSAKTHQEVVRSDIAVEKSMPMQSLYSVQNLQGANHGCLETESTPTEFEELLKVRPQ